MSPQTRRSFWRSAWRQMPFFVWLIALWMMLWGQFSVLAFVSGIVIAIFVTRVFQLPPVELSGRINLWHGLVFIVTFLGALVWGSLQVAWQALAPRREKGAAIVAVQLVTDDDLIQTHVGVTASLIPGSLVAATDRERRILYLHAIGVRNMADVEAFRTDTLRWERRIVRAVGSRDQVKAVEKARAAR